MATYIILSRISPGAFGDPKDFKKIAEEVSSKIRKQCPDVVWKQSFATFGRFDIVDIVESRDAKQVEKAAMIIRAYGNSSTETLPATPWKQFLASL
ncbi:MAG TPA: GYD domain-containing protein [Terriglobales bacterium]|jgi:uncharacterized protein with GYD domain|nr:GYD domain-containing protein [Terriglobales bacterium]